MPENKSVRPTPDTSLRERIIDDPDFDKMLANAQKYLANKAHEKESGISIPSQRLERPTPLSQQRPRRFTRGAFIKGAAGTLAAGLSLYSLRTQAPAPLSIETPRAPISSAPPEALPPAPAPATATPTRVEAPLPPAPTAQSKIPKVEIAPSKEIPGLPYLGIRNNNPDLMRYVPEMGATRVRIVSDNNLADTPSIQSALQKAKEKDLKILYTFNPSSMPGKNQIQKHLQTILSRYEVDLEIGNEPDETTNDYWEDFEKSGNSLKSFAEFTKSTIEEARKIKPSIGITIGACIRPDLHQEALVTELKKAGVDINSVRFAVHAYEKSELERNIAAVQKATKRRDFVITELGIDDEKSEDLPRLITLARNSGAGDVYIHELPQNEKQWGLINPGTHTKLPKFHSLRNFAIESARNNDLSKLAPYS